MRTIYLECRRSYLVRNASRSKHCRAEVLRLIIQNSKFHYTRRNLVCVVMTGEMSSISGNSKKGISANALPNQRSFSGARKLMDPINPRSTCGCGEDGSIIHEEAPRAPKTGPPSRSILLGAANRSYYAPAKYAADYKTPPRTGARHLDRQPHFILFVGA